MLAGASVMDASLLLIAANETCPQPQTSEHEGKAAEQHLAIKEFIKGTKAENSPIIPISGQLGYNIDVVCDYIC